MGPCEAGAVGHVPRLWDTPLVCGTVTLSSLLAGHAHLTDFNIATIIKDGERATALAGTKPYMGEPWPRPPSHPPCQLLAGLPR